MLSNHAVRNGNGTEYVVGKGKERATVVYMGECTTLDAMRLILKEYLVCFRKRAASIQDLLEMEKALKVNRYGICDVYVTIFHMHCYALPNPRVNCHFADLCMLGTLIDSMINAVHW